MPKGGDEKLLREKRETKAVEIETPIEGLQGRRFYTVNAFYKPQGGALAYIKAKRRQGASYQMIADFIAQETGVKLSLGTVRLWHRKADPNPKRKYVRKAQARKPEAPLVAPITGGKPPLFAPTLTLVGR
jgi:hypothetical protein